MDWKPVIVIAGLGGLAYFLSSKKGTSQLYNLLATGAVTAFGHLLLQGVQDQNPPFRRLQ